MASLFDMYGIKEVADVTLYEITKQQGAEGKDVEVEVPVMYFDTLKVSTIEESASNTSANGGKGNAKLVSWDYGKEITLNLEDALFSPQSLALMHGSKVTENDAGHQLEKTFFLKEGPSLTETKPVGKVSPETTTTTTLTYTLPDNVATFIGDAEIVEKGSEATLLEGKQCFISLSIPGVKELLWGKSGAAPSAAVSGNSEKPSVTFETKDSNVETQAKKGGAILTVFLNSDTANNEVISISADTFPGVYKVVGDTYIRNRNDGKDEFFQFIIPRAKMSPSVSLTMQADGDPSTFSMSMQVLRPDDGVMMKLVAYPNVKYENSVLKPN